MISIGIVDNDSLVLFALKTYFYHLPKRVFDVLWTSTSGYDCIERTLLTSRPDLLLVDMSLSDISGANVIRSIRRKDNLTPIIAMTSFPLDKYAGSAYFAGAQLIVDKSDLRQMINGISQVKEGIFGMYKDICFRSPQNAYESLRKNSKLGIEKLTDKEIYLINLCKQGYSSSEMSSMTGLSVATINTYFQRACEKTCAKNRIHLVSMWLEDHDE